jgi:hypothetical protein
MCCWLIWRHSLYRWISIGAVELFLGGTRVRTQCFENLTREFSNRFFVIDGLTSSEEMQFVSLFVFFPQLFFVRLVIVAEWKPVCIFVGECDSVLRVQNLFELPHILRLIS